MSTLQFHERLRQETEAIWQAIYTHPFIQEVGQGTLARSAFEFFICQDYVYLKDFARVLCLGGAKADDLETLAMFTEHAATVVQVEHNFHTSFAVQLGLTVAALDATPAAPVYAQPFLVRVAVAKQVGLAFDVLRLEPPAGGPAAKNDGADQHQGEDYTPDRCKCFHCCSFSL